jgi:PadR family transcriptional regulator PadR
VAHSPVAMPQLLWHAYVVSTQEDPMAEAKLDLLQGTLDLMVLQTLQAMGAMHGYGIARRIEQVSGDEILLNQGTIYASLVRLQQRGWIAAEWGTSDHNRKAK